MFAARQAKSNALTSVCLAAMIALCLGDIATGQTNEAGGMRLTFGFDQRLQWQDNPDLDIPATKGNSTSRTLLRFGFLSETRTQRLAFDLSGTLATGNGPEKGLVSPSVEMTYGLENSGSALELTAFLREEDVDDLAFVTGTSPLGSPIITAVPDKGVRRQIAGTARLEFGRDAPFGGSLTIGHTETDYKQTTAASLVDSRRTNATIALRFDLSAVTSASVTVSEARLDEVGLAPKNTSSLTLGIRHDRPDGAYIANLSTNHTSVGSRQSLRIGRELDLPNSMLSLAMGVTNSMSGKTRMIGAINWQQEYARGSFRIGLSQDVDGDDRNNETRATRIVLSAQQEITPTLGLNVSAGYQKSHEIVAGVTTSTTNISASLRKELTSDWGLNVGATHRMRDEKGVGRARSSSVFLSISREFEFRP